MNKSAHFTLAMLAGLIAIPSPHALAMDEHGDEHGAHHMMPAGTAAQTSFPMSEGEVKKVDRDAGKVTIKHGPLANLRMPGMTMVFRVKDAAWLEQLKPGDKIRFVAERAGNGYTVVRMEPAQPK